MRQRTRGGPGRHRADGGRLAALAIAATIAFTACAGTAPASVVAPADESLGPVTPAPEPGAFGCPVQVLAGSPPTSRLVDVRVTNEGTFDRVAFMFRPGPASKPAADSGLIVRPVYAPPQEDAQGRPLTVAGEQFIEVRFRDMALVDDVGGSSFVGSRDMKPTSGAVREVVQIEESPLALDWLIGTMAPGCARVWVDGSERLVVDVRH